MLTFGQPAVFTQRGAQKHSKLPYFRITHQRDIVPCLFPGMYHAGTEIMVFADSKVAIVPSVEREEGKGLAAKVISSTLARARQLDDSAGSPPSSMLSPNKGSKGSSLAALQLREQQQVTRPSFSQAPPMHSSGMTLTPDLQRSFQDLLWEENRVTSYVPWVKGSEQQQVVLFDSKRNEI